MNFPEELKYTDSHEWVKMLDEQTALIGLTEYAQSELGDLVFVNLPEADTELSAGEAMADVESVKAVSDVYSPVTGRVEEVNEELMDHPEFINETPYESWLVKAADIADTVNLMTAQEYAALVEQEQQ